MKHPTHKKDCHFLDKSSQEICNCGIAERLDEYDKDKEKNRIMTPQTIYNQFLELNSTDVFDADQLYSRVAQESNRANLTICDCLYRHYITDGSI